MGFLINRIKDRFEERKKEHSSFSTGTVMMMSGCEDAQVSANVSSVTTFRLPDPAVPDETSGTRRALLIGIKYTGHEQGVLSGCHNDVQNMIEYIKGIQGFEDENIAVLLDDDEHTSPSTKANIMEAYRTIVAKSGSGDAIFLHFSGHGASIWDDDYGEEADGFDECLVPQDYVTNGLIRDDDLFKTIIQPLPPNVCVTALMDCCHSGTVLDLPYVFKADGEQQEMQIDEGFNSRHRLGKVRERIRRHIDEAPRCGNERDDVQKAHFDEAV